MFEVETAAVNARALAKQYPAHRALDGIDLSLSAGSTLALIGHNGAGKTTLMKLILGLIRPTAGSLTVLGVEPASAPLVHRRQIGFLPENVAFHPELTGAQTLRFYARLKGAPPAQCGLLLERVGLAFAAGRRVKTYSKGMRQRLGLAQALLSEPKLLLLDEPTTGLDPASRGEFFKIVGELSAAGATVIISSHILTELEAKTDLVAIMNTGRLVAFGPLDSLRHEADLPVKLSITALGTAHQAVERLGELAIHATVTADGGTADVFCRPHDKMAALAVLTSPDCAVTDVAIVQPGLDEVYRHFSPVPPGDPNEGDS